MPEAVEMLSKSIIIHQCNPRTVEGRKCELLDRDLESRNVSKQFDVGKYGCTDHHRGG